MKRKTSHSKYVIAALGIFLLTTGLYLFFGNRSDSLPYILIGAGCGFLGQGLGEIFSPKRLSDAEFRQLDIETKDERNIALAHQSKAKAYTLMLYVHAALLLSFILMKMEIKFILLLTFAYLLMPGYAIYWRMRLDREI